MECIIGIDLESVGAWVHVNMHDSLMTMGSNRKRLHVNCMHDKQPIATQVYIYIAR